MSCVSEMGVNKNDSNFNENDFDLCFKKVDEDGSGLIDKAEMLEFIHIVNGKK